MEGRQWELIDNERPWTANAERTWHHMKRAKCVRLCRERFYWLALAAQIPKLNAVSVEVRPTVVNRRGFPDVAACFPAAKAGIDGLVDAGVIPNDTPNHLLKLTFFPATVTGKDSMRITVKEEL